MYRRERADQTRRGKRRAGRAEYTRPVNRAQRGPECDAQPRSSHREPEEHQDQEHTDQQADDPTCRASGPAHWRSASPGRTSVPDFGGARYDETNVAPVVDVSAKRASRNGAGLTGARVPVTRASTISPTAGESLKPWQGTSAADPKPRTATRRESHTVRRDVERSSVAAAEIASASAGMAGRCGQHVRGHRRTASCRGAPGHRGAGSRSSVSDPVKVRSPVSGRT